MLRGGGKYSSSSVTDRSRRRWPERGAPALPRRNSSGADAPAVTPTADSPSGSSAAELTRWTDRQPASMASCSSARVLDEFDDPMTTIASHRPRSPTATTGGSWWRSTGRCGPASTVGEPLATRHGDTLPIAVRERGLGEQRDRFVELRQRVDLADATRPGDRIGRDRHRADGFLVPLVAHVDDAIPLAGTHLHLVVHLRDERAHRVDDEAATCSRAAATTSGAEPCADSMIGATRRHFVTSSTKTTPRALEPLDHDLVVDDLVVAVHGRLERSHHPCQRLDRHLDAGAEAAGAQARSTRSDWPIGRDIVT